MCKLVLFLRTFFFSTRTLKVLLSLAIYRSYAFSCFFYLVLVLLQTDPKIVRVFVYIRYLVQASLQVELLNIFLPFNLAHKDN